MRQPQQNTQGRDAVHGKIDQRIRQEKHANISELTDTLTLKTLETMHRQLANLANNSGIRIKPLKDIEKDLSLCPEEATDMLHPKTLERFLAAPCNKVEGLAPATVPTCHDILMQKVDQEDGHATLHQILPTAPCCFKVYLCGEERDHCSKRG
jgi:hypothetical protein